MTKSTSKKGSKPQNNGRRLSLYGLTVEEALANLLRVKPEKKAPKKKRATKKT